MTKAELKLELLKIVHHASREPRHVLEAVAEYEKAFDGLLDAEGGASSPPSSSAKSAKK